MCSYKQSKYLGLQVLLKSWNVIKFNFGNTLTSKSQEIQLHFSNFCIYHQLVTFKIVSSISLSLSSCWCCLRKRLSSRRVSLFMFDSSIFSLAKFLTVSSLFISCRRAFSSCLSRWATVWGGALLIVAWEKMALHYRQKFDELGLFIII